MVDYYYPVYFYYLNSVDGSLLYPQSQQILVLQWLILKRLMLSWPQGLHGKIQLIQARNIQIVTPIKDSFMTSEARYQEWLQFLFNHDEKDGEWQFNSNHDMRYFDHYEVVELFTRMCTNFSQDTQQFNNWQIANGIVYIMDNDYSNMSFDLRDGPAPMNARIKAIESIKQLFVQGFNTRCEHVLTNNSRFEINSLKWICYNFWSKTPLTSTRKHPDKEILNINFCEAMEFCTTLPNPACVESGIRGLSSLSKHYSIAKERLEALIESDILRDPALIEYAKLKFNTSTNY